MNTRTLNLTRVLILTLLLSGTVVARNVKVLITGGYEKIESFSSKKIEYVSLSGLVDVLGGSLDWEAVGYQIRCTGPGYRFDFIIESPFFKLNDSTYNMTYPSVYKDGMLFVSAATFIPFLDRVTDRRITWDADSRNIRVNSEYFNVTDLAVSAKANGLLIEIFLTTALNYDIFVTEGNWLNVSIRDARINNRQIVSRRDTRYMYRVKTHQAEASGQVSIRLKRNIENWHHKLAYDPPRIQISIADVSFEIDTADSNPVIGPDARIDVIAVDAGHGGRDYGAVGRKGTKEKDVTLKIAKQLAGLIRKDKQFKVVMTRDRDKSVSLNERAKIANDAGADLFVSIHANASPRRNVRGWNVFFLAQARNDSARAAEQLENSFFLRELNISELQGEDMDENGASDPIVGILNEMIMTEFQAESHDLAMMIDRELRRKLSRITT
jgi:N-acetylmuramoyl-L-alanine amidase